MSRRCASRHHSWIAAALAALGVAVNGPIEFAGSGRRAQADEAEASVEPAPPAPEPPPPEPPTPDDTPAPPGGAMERPAVEPVDQSSTPAAGAAAISPDGRSETARAPAAVSPSPRPAPRRPAPPRVAHAPNEVAIRLAVEPSGVAHAFWGVKDLGEAPLEIIRPRDSGPMDLLLRAPGYLTFHTRAYTDRDDKIAIRMVPNFQAAGTFGYRIGARADSPVDKTRDPKSGFHREKPSPHGTKR